MKRRSFLKGALALIAIPASICGITFHKKSKWKPLTECLSPDRKEHLTKKLLEAQAEYKQSPDFYQEYMKSNVKGA